MSRASGVVAALAIVLLSSHAGADAVPPPPDDCPAGKVPTTSHSGSWCVDPAPENCAPGHRGVVGGNCELSTCSTNAECPQGQRCREVPTCQEFRELSWDGWRWSRNDPPRRSNLLAGPPKEPPEESPPETWVPLDTCGPKGECEPHAECRPFLLCYPDDKKPPALPPSGCGKGCHLGHARGLPWIAAAVVLLYALRRWKRRARSAEQE